MPPLRLLLPLLPLLPLFPLWVLMTIQAVIKLLGTNYAVRPSSIQHSFRFLNTIDRVFAYDKITGLVVQENPWDRARCLRITTALFTAVTLVGAAYLTGEDLWFFASLLIVISIFGGLAYAWAYYSKQAFSLLEHHLEAVRGLIRRRSYFVRYDKVQKNRIRSESLARLRWAPSPKYERRVNFAMIF